MAVLSQFPLAPSVTQSCLSTNDKDDYEMIPSEGCGTSHRLKWDSLLPNDVCRIVQHVKEGVGRKEGRDRGEG